MAIDGDNAGLSLLLTGLPGAGKTTLSQALTRHFSQHFDREVTLLDGDEVRRLLSSDLGYSREHRRLNVLRHAFVAAELCRHGAIVLCALIAPYAADRADMRRMVSAHGRFVEVYLSTPLAVCEQRDPKGLYSRARAGQLSHLTGIDDPYENPQQPELALDTSVLSVPDSVAQVVAYLQAAGALASRR